MIYILGLMFSLSFADFGILKLQGTIEDCTPLTGGIEKPRQRFIKAEDTLKEGTCLRSNDGYIILKKKGYIISMKAPFSMNVSSQKPYITYGKARFKLENIKDFKLQTRNAVVGVRGTDFFASYQPDLGETEVICFSSQIVFSDLDGKNEKLISAGFWGGKGGRFGINITEPIKLEKNFLATVKNDLAF
jgi:hypothetical protein